jgi:hypothetical protein
MQMDIYTCLVQGNDLMVEVKEAPVAYRIRHIKANDMEVFIQCAVK